MNVKAPLVQTTDTASIKQTATLALAKEVTLEQIVKLVGLTR